MPAFNMCEVLSEATKLSPRVRESAFLYARRLIKELAADEFPADEWDTLPDEAQQWVNQQIRATNENKQVEEVPGFEEFIERIQRFNQAGNGEEVKPQRVQRVRAVAPAEVEPEEEEEAPPPRAARAAPVARAKANPTPTVVPVEEDEEEEEPPKPKAAREKAPKQPGAARAYMTRKRPDGKPSAIIRIKEFLIHDGHLTPNQIMEKLDAEGYTVSQTTVVSCKADFRATLSLLQEKGLLRQQML
jgi:hypothetical protein